ncbi:hypothetical protein SCACP_21790 [Sporomusa carbonis]|uniref:helix-turn-helix domain-containing protein n=1 Tax=Sporomusa carbonis TaxID=3076075 RepID=UPI003A6F7896
MINKLGEFVRTTRGKRSLREFAKQCGISHTHLDSIEKGYDPRTGKKVSLTIETLEKLAKGLNTDTDFLVKLSLDSDNGVIFPNAINSNIQYKHSEPIVDLSPGAGPFDKNELLNRLLSPEEKATLELARKNKYSNLVAPNSNQDASSSNPLPPLTPKDEREIAKDLEAMLNALDDKSGMAAYNDPEDEEDRELLRASLEYSMRLAKQLAKKKFTPKKYRKE